MLQDAHYSTLFSKRRSNEVCRPKQVLFVDVRPLSLHRTPDPVCYIPLPILEEMALPNTTRVIPNFATSILSFIYPLHTFEYVPKYMKSSYRPRQLHYEVHNPSNMVDAIGMEFSGDFFLKQVCASSRHAVRT